MSNHQQNPSELIKSSASDDHKEQKVIVLSIKDMPSFKLKEIYGNQEGGQPIFNFKPQQLLQSPPGSSSIPLQVTQQQQPKTTANIQKIMSTTPTQYVIRAQQTMGSATSIAPKTAKPPQPQQQLISLVVTPTGVSETPKLISSQVTIQNLVRNQALPPVQMQAKKIISTQQLLNQQQKPIQVLQTAAKPVIAIQPKPAQQYKVFQQHPAIIAQQPSQIVIKTQPSVGSQQNPWKTKYITLQSGPAKPKPMPPPKLAPTTAGSSIVFTQPQNIPALAPIQRKVFTTIAPSAVEKPLEMPIESPEEDSDEMSGEDEAPEQSEEFLDVKRIIEGDDLNSSNYESKASEEEEKIMREEEEMKDKSSEVITSEQMTLSSDLLLCDEEISSISPEVSPSEKGHDESSATPTQQSPEISFKSMATESVKKTLNLDLGPNVGKIQLNIEMEEEEDSVISDDTNISMHKNTTADNDDDSMHSKSEISVIASSEMKAPKRNRKSKNPTVNTNLGLPFKPQTGNGRKKKAEKKVELELDFHDPLNKILWDDGIGGLNNCNKLFGFDDFGLVEVVTKKDAKAKVGQFESVDSNFKFKKILSPEDQFVCVVCSKMGTIRDFFSPECCSESCLAITKRKAFEYGNRDEQHDSGQSSPTSDAKKVMYDGEMVSLQHLQTYLLQQKLPGHKSKLGGKKPQSWSSTDTFSWSSYLNSKSVPAPPELFKNFRQQQPNNPFHVGMKLEAIDPKGHNLFCVCTVEERLGHRVKLHFDGFPSTYDFWVDCGSKNIFPIDFCRATKRQLQLPPKWPNKNFDWSEFLDAQNSAGAQRQMFPHLLKKEEPCIAKIGMKLEAFKEDAWFAATIVDVFVDRLLVKFDGSHEVNGHAWFDFNSPYIGPCDGHKSDEEVTTFRPPVGEPESFSWHEYLKSTNSQAVPVSFFELHEPLKNEFEPGMKLEIVDKVNPQLIRPATILSRSESKIQVNFDGFDISFAYWIDCDSEDIYPINHCKQTGHPIEHPAGHQSYEESICSTAGCRGVGNGIFPERYFHERTAECPYNAQNWKRLMEKKACSRLEFKDKPAKRSYRTQKENGTGEKRQSLLKVKREVKQEIENLPSFEQAYEEPQIEQSAPQKRQRKRKSQQADSEEGDSNAEAKIRVVEDFLRGYGPQFNYSFTLWKENSKILDKATMNDGDLSENPLKWTVDEVCTFMLKFCSEETSAKFYAQKIDGEALLSLCQNDLVALMDIKAGPAIKIYNRILHLRQEVVEKFIEI